nr:MAG TPA: hypothetical protein [Caudoviricetes sp.]
MKCMNCKRDYMPTKKRGFLQSKLKIWRIL